MEPRSQCISLHEHISSNAVAPAATGLIRRVRFWLKPISCLRKDNSGLVLVMCGPLRQFVATYTCGCERPGEAKLRPLGITTSQPCNCCANIKQYLLRTRARTESDNLCSIRFGPHAQKEWPWSPPGAPESRYCLERDWVIETRL